MSKIKNECGILDLHRFLGKRWTYSLMHNIGDKPISYNQLYNLNKRIINPTLLSDRLKELTKFNIIKKVSDKNRIYYSITGEGKKLKKLLNDIKNISANLNCKIPDQCLEGDCSNCTEFKKLEKTIYH
tara:strand:- start:5742 stop:6125 length:384 start_codon:yes stop_codon:yes gene_type:complete